MSVYFSKCAEWMVGCTEENMIEVVEKSAGITRKLVFPVFAE